MDDPFVAAAQEYHANTATTDPFEQAAKEYHAPAVGMDAIKRAEDTQHQLEFEASPVGFWATQGLAGVNRAINTATFNAPENIANQFGYTTRPNTEAEVTRSIGDATGFLVPWGAPNRAMQAVEAAGIANPLLRHMASGAAGMAVLPPTNDEAPGLVDKAKQWALNTVIGAGLGAVGRGVEKAFSPRMPVEVKAPVTGEQAPLDENLSLEEILNGKPQTDVPVDNIARDAQGNPITIPPNGQPFQPWEGIQQVSPAPQNPFTPWAELGKAPEVPKIEEPVVEIPKRGEYLADPENPDEVYSPFQNLPEEDMMKTDPGFIEEQRGSAENPAWSREILYDAGKGKPGLTVVNNDEGMVGLTRVTYRAPDGRPVLEVSVNEKGEVHVLAKEPNNKSLLMGKAVKAVQQHLESIGGTNLAGIDSTSDSGRRLYTKYKNSKIPNDMFPGQGYNEGSRPVSAYDDPFDITDIKGTRNQGQLNYTDDFKTRMDLEKELRDASTKARIERAKEQGTLKQLPTAAPDEVQTMVTRPSTQADSTVGGEISDAEKKANEEIARHALAIERKDTRNPNHWMNLPEVKQEVAYHQDQVDAATKAGDQQLADFHNQSIAHIVDENSAAKPGAVEAIKGQDKLDFTQMIKDVLSIMKDRNAGLSIKDPRVTAEAEAALERWRVTHGPKLKAAAQAAGKDLATYIKENHPTLTPEQIAKVAEAVGKPITQLTTPGNPSVDITTKKNRKGQDLGQYHQKMNLSVFEPDVAAGTANLMDRNPKLTQTKRISNERLIEMAKDIDTANIFEHIVQTREGTLASQVVFKSQKSASAVASFLKATLPDDLAKVGDELASMATRYMGDVKKVKSELGRALQATQIPIEVQKDFNEQFNNLIALAKKNPEFKKNPKLVNQLKVFRDSVVSADLNPSMWDKAYYIWMHSILGPSTQVYAAGSNSVQLLGKFLDRSLAVVFDKFAISPFTGKRVTTGDELGAMWRGLFKNSKDLPEELQHQSSKNQENVPIVEPVNNTYSRTISEIGGKQLGRTDKFFGNKVASMEWEALKNKTGLQKQDIIDLVTDESKRTTFTRDPGKLAKLGGWLKKNIPGARWVLPFTRSPADIAGQEFDRSIVGSVGNLVKGGAKGEYSGTLGQRKLAQDLGVATQAAALVVWVANMYKDGNITGAGDVTADKRENTQLIQKRPANSVRFTKGGKWHSYQWAEPVAGAIALVADALDGYYDKNAPEDVYGRVTYALSKASVSFLNKRYLSGIQNLMGASSNPGGFGTKTVNSIAGGFIPSYAKAVRDIVDPAKRQVTNPAEAVVNRVPYASKMLRPTLDPFGRKVPIVPPYDITGTSSKQTSAEKAASGLSTSKPQKRIGDYRFTPQEYDSVTRAAGHYKQQLYSQLSRAIASQPQAIKEKIGAKINAAANNRALAEFKAPKISDAAAREKFFPFLKDIAEGRYVNKE